MEETTEEIQEQESQEEHPSAITLAIHPGAIADGDTPPEKAHVETIPLAVNEPVKPPLRPFRDEDPHGFKSQGQGDLSKLHKF